MINLKVRKKMMALALANVFVLSTIPANTSYATETVETIDITEFEDIRDVVVAKDQDVAIKDKPGTGYGLLGILKPGESLKLITDIEKDYEVLYKGKIGYVNKQFVYESTIDDMKKSTDAKNIVKAITATEIKAEPSDNSETIGTLRVNESLKVKDKQDGYYVVSYKDKIAYVNDSSVSCEEVFDKSGYIYKDTSIYTTTELDEKITDIPELEFIKIYDETENAYYTEVNGVSGYVAKDSVKLLDDKYIVVDISDQVAEMYDNNDLLLSSAVVTGMPPKHSTPTGVYYIGDESGEITDHRDLIGRDENGDITYRSRITYMMKFIENRGIGFHDSEYGVDDTGIKHGWRNASEYGGTTYLTNGSHGCVNMPNEATKEMYDIVAPYVVEQGNKVKVLVKE